MVLYDLSKTLWVCKATTHVVILGVNALPYLLFEMLLLYESSSGCFLHSRSWFGELKTKSCPMVNASALLQIRRMKLVRWIEQTVVACV